MSTDLAKDEQSVVQLQLSFSQRLHNSPYYVVERTQNNELPRYSDKYRPSQGARATLRRRDLNPDFFPTEVLNDYFNPPRKRKCDLLRYHSDRLTHPPAAEAKSGLSKRAINLDEFNDEDNDQACWPAPYLSISPADTHDTSRTSLTTTVALKFQTSKSKTMTSTRNMIMTTQRTTLITARMMILITLVMVGEETRVEEVSIFLLGALDPYSFRRHRL